MARVWTARDEALDRPVAVKLLLEHLAEDDSFVRRFRAEALAAARLTHPAVVSVYDTLSADGVEAIVMELVDGTTLRHLMDRDGRIDVAEAARISARIAEALTVAHRAGIVHRDIKPANVLLSSTGRVVVTDFGIAKASEGADLTTDSQMLGTAKYLAPEQVESKPVDGRSDIYALGVVLYEMVCGQVPFKADTEAGTALARLHQDPPPPRRIRPDLPEDVARIVLRMLARDPADRWPDAPSLARTLAALAGGRALPPEPPGARVDTVAPSRPQFRPVASPTSPSPRASPSPHARTAEPVAAGRAGAAASAPRSPPPAGGTDPLPTDRPPTSTSTSTPTPRSSRRLAPALLLVTVVGLSALVIGALGWRVLGPEGAETITPAATDFDPFFTGPPGENPDLVPRAVDGDPQTGWETERYDDPDIAAFKGGVGLALDLGEPRTARTLDVRSPSTGWTAEVYVLDAQPDGPVESWGEPEAGADAIGGDVRFDLAGSEGRILILWITRTTDEGTVAVNEVTVEVQ